MGEMYNEGTSNPQHLVTGHSFVAVTLVPILKNESKKKTPPTTDDRQLYNKIIIT